MLKQSDDPPDDAHSHTHTLLGFLDWGGQVNLASPFALAACTWALDVLTEQTYWSSAQTRQSLSVFLGLEHGMES